MGSFLIVIVLFHGILRICDADTITCNSGSICGPCTTGDQCTLQCNDDLMCANDNLYCRTGYPCTVKCQSNGDSTCTNANVHGNGATSLIISCEDDQDACQSITVNASNTEDVTMNCYSGADMCRSSTLICGTTCSLLCEGSACSGITVDVSRTAEFSCTGSCPPSVPLPFTPNPTLTPSLLPTNNPTGIPTGIPTGTPTLIGVTKTPTNTPTTPTGNPSKSPTKMPTSTSEPSILPSQNPTKSPTKTPTKTPTKMPTLMMVTTVSPSNLPTKDPSNFPTKTPTVPTVFPTYLPILSTKDDEEVRETTELPEVTENNLLDGGAEGSQSASIVLIISVTCGVGILITLCIIIIIIYNKRKNKSYTTGDKNVINLTKITSVSSVDTQENITNEYNDNGSPVPDTTALVNDDNVEDMYTQPIIDNVTAKGPNVQQILTVEGNDNIPINKQLPPVPVVVPITAGGYVDDDDNINSDAHSSSNEDINSNYQTVGEYVNDNKNKNEYEWIEKTLKKCDKKEWEKYLYNFKKQKLTDKRLRHIHGDDLWNGLIPELGLRLEFQELYKKTSTE